MNEPKKKEWVVLGLALFAMFFGAGNLIFPPSLGFEAGEQWGYSLLGFLMTGVGLPMLGVMAFNKAGSIEAFTNKVSHKFSVIYCSVLIISLGPLLAIPRTGATTFEVGITPNFSAISPWVSSAIYFLVTLVIVLNPSKIIDNIGKILTPIILVMLLTIITKGIEVKLGVPAIVSTDENFFGIGFLDGYQTMDALGAMLLGSIILSLLKKSGHHDPIKRKKLIFKASLLAGAGLAIIYGGLLYLGATTSAIVTGLSKTELVMYIAENTLGSLGSSVLGLAISAACLTTSSALVMCVGDYFSKITRLSYKTIVTLTCIFSAVMAVQGVDMIIKISEPILMVLYPITIILIVLNFFEVKEKMIYRISLTAAILASMIDLGAEVFHIDIFIAMFDQIPLSHAGFVWLLPTLILTASYLSIKRLRN